MKSNINKKCIAYLKYKYLKFQNHPSYEANKSTNKFKNSKNILTFSLLLVLMIGLELL